MKEFKNKVAAITGSATGIGRAFAEEAAKRGMRLALIDINTEGLEETKAICEKAGAPKVVTIKTDVTKYEEVRFSILRVMQEYGQLDLMFANAGIATAGWVYNHPPQDWAWAMNTNVLGLTYYVHEVLPIFKQQGTPCHFLFTASIAGLITGLRYNTAYLASKHAAVCIAEAVRDLAETDPDYSMMGVSVFCPEYVHTYFHNSEDHRPADYSVPCDPFYATDSYWDYRRLFDSNITVKGMNPAFVGPYLFEAVEDERLARELAEQRIAAAKEKQFSSFQKVTLDNLFSQMAQNDMKELAIVVKADVQGSAEAVKQSLEKISNDEVRVRVIHAGVGAISKSDVDLADASNAIIIGFNVRPDNVAKEEAAATKVEMRMYRVIYDAINDVTDAMKGMLAPKFREVSLGELQVRQVYKISNVGTVAGCRVTSGKITRDSKVRVVRDGIVITEDEIASLKRFKDDAKEVAEGYECGVTLAKFADVKEGDVYEAFKMEEYRD